jgi:crossover junction endodeoxyribonuclease RuvC
MNVAGIDVGVTGALALINTHQGFLSVHDLPIHQLKVGKTLRHELDLASLRQLLLATPIDHVVIEKVASRPGQGVSSVFKFGFSAGSIYGLVIGLQLPVSYLTPQQWQKTVRVGPTPDAGRRRAGELYPAAAEYLNLKKHSGRGDAILITHAGLMMLRQPAAAA